MIGLILKYDLKQVEGVFSLFFGGERGVGGSWLATAPCHLIILPSGKLENKLAACVSHCVCVRACVYLHAIANTTCSADGQ